MKLYIHYQFYTLTHFVSHSTRSETQFTNNITSGKADHTLKGSDCLFLLCFFSKDIFSKYISVRFVPCNIIFVQSVIKRMTFTVIVTGISLSFSLHFVKVKVKVEVYSLVSTLQRSHAHYSLVNGPVHASAISTPLGAYKPISAH